MCWRVTTTLLFFIKEVKYKMINFEDIEELVDYMFENCEEQTVSVVANKDIVTDVLKELLYCEDTEVDICELDNDEEYDREYAVMLYKEPDLDKWTFGVEKIYIKDQNKYISTGDYTLFHEDVNSKALIDMQNNECMPISNHDWFTVGKEELEDEDTDEDDFDEDGLDDSEYSITVKVRVDTDEAEKIIRNMRKDFQREMSGMFDMLYRPYLYEYHPQPLRFYW